MSTSLQKLQELLQKLFRADAADLDYLPLVKRYLEAQARHGSPQTCDHRTDAVFNHLYTFFSRYYEDGDFIPHKDLEQFLTRELDVYIKNEVIPLSEFLLNSCEYGGGKCQFNK